uniref:40S ribosomal protein S27 n=1 Tax=Anas platyrhynchos platyrhynchos TaxID=8840 RepID=A0A493TK64_ANAPP
MAAPTPAQRPSQDGAAPRFRPCGEPRGGYSGARFRFGPFPAAAARTPPCPWPRTCCTRPPRRRRGSTRRSAWCRAPTPTSWTSSAPVGAWGRGRGGGRGARFPPGAAPRPNAAPSPPPRALPAGCYKITTVFSHAQTVVLCVGCSTVLCQPTGGKARLTEGAWGGRRAPGGRHGTVNRWVKKWLGLYGAFFR